MPLASTKAITLFGLSGTLLEVEADISSNLPNFILVGLPDASLSEATARVRAACANSKLPLPGRRITVNLSPASVPKRGSSFDLAIALAVLAASALVERVSVANWLHIGELGLDGSLRPVHGVLPSLLAAKRLGITRFIVPRANLSEANAVSGVEVRAFDHLTQVASFHGAQVAVQEPAVETVSSQDAEPAKLCFSEVMGQSEAVNALTIAAAGGHHMLMVGSPGAGKTMLAERLPTILPELDEDQVIETAAVSSLSGLEGGLSRLPPFRAPHHSASTAALIGGGLGVPRPGLISLAHNGVLFLDEAPEFQAPALESLRQPLESGEVFISRAAGVARFPARFQLVMAANPCPCGFAWELNGRCTCAEPAKSRYLGKLSGPLLDRVDINLKVARQPRALEAAVNQSSAQMRETVVQARQLIRQRLVGTPWTLNSQIPGTYLRKNLKPHRRVTAPLDRALERGALSMRGYDRCLRLALTIAALRFSDDVSEEDLGLALYLRGAEL